MRFRPEALFMLIVYCVYCIVLSFNESLERYAKSLNLPYLPKDSDPADESALVSYRSLQEERLSYTGPNSPVTDQVKSEGSRFLYTIRSNSLFAISVKLNRDFLFPF